jgi:lysophospholipase L1-like esterase
MDWRNRIRSTILNAIDKEISVGGITAYIMSREICSARRLDIVVAAALAVLLARSSGSALAAAQPSSTPAPSINIGEQVTLGGVDTLLFFDRFFMKSSTAISPNYLERVADPTSRFHADYLKYKKREINRAELVLRLPHMAVFGDSLSKDAYVSSIPSTFWRARTRRGKDWFLDTDPSPNSIYSVFERLGRVTPLVATEYSGVGALVDAGTAKANFFRQLVRTRNFSGQVDQLLKGRRYPDLILLWIGHNNLDWAAGISTSEREHPEKHFEQLARTFRENYERQVRRLISRAQTENHKVSIVVYGLVNFEAFFKARAQTEALKAENPKLYPYLEVDYQHFISMRPEYRKGMIKLALMINQELQTMVADLNRTHPPNMQVRYSNALANVDIGRAELIHAMDAWHPSAKGHNVLAEAAFSALPPSLEFLGILPKGMSQ